MSINSGIKKQKKYIADENGNHTLTSLWTSTDTVEDSVGNTLTELLAQIGDPTVTVVASEESGIAKRYTIYQGGTAVSVPIDIPLDMVIQSGSLVDITFHDDKLWDGATDVTALIMPAGQTPTSANAGKYIKLVIANSSGDIIYISLLDLTFTDENVKQNYVTDAEIIRPLLLAGSNDAQTKIEDTSKTPTLKYNTKGSHLMVTDLSTPSKYIDIKPDDVALNGSGNTWDGTNTSLKSAIASAGGTDENVKQSPTTTNSNYEVLLSGTADNTEHTEGTKKSDGLKYNPSKQSLSNGFLNNASGYYSHAEGDQTIASGANSHSEGSGNTASGNTAHAEGSQNYASGTYSHVEGTQNEATHYCQHVLGMFNELDPSSATADSRGTYVEIVGNGTNGSNRSNARTLDWDGNETLAGTLTANDVINTGYWDGNNTSLKTAIAYSKTASGSIASFDDGSTLPLKTLQVSIEPVQDLHGYDAPWVGGGGKNKMPTTLADWASSSYSGYGVTLSIQSDGGIKINGTSSYSGDLRITIPVNFTIPSGSWTLSMTGANANIRWISTGDNGFNYTSKYGDFTQTYTITATSTPQYLYIDIASGVAINTILYIQLESGTSKTTYAPYENICPISGWTECNVKVCDDVDNPTVENEYTIEFTDGTNPLTVYGGTLDVTSGGLTVDRAMVDLGTLTWGYSTADARFYNNSVDYKRLASAEEVANAICSQYVVTKLGTLNDGMMCLYTNGYIYIKDSRYTDATTFKTAMNGVQLVYELATPQTYQLTPTAVASILGVNNVYADTGNVLACEYVPNNLIAKIEKDIIDNSGAQTNINYSTTEQDTGIKWIDGRPIYQKTYYLSAFDSTIDSSFTPDVYDHYWQKDISWRYDSGGYHYVGSMFGGVGGCIYTECDSRGLLSANNTGVTPEDIYITIQYTKTADIVTP